MALPLGVEVSMPGSRNWSNQNQLGLLFRRVVSLIYGRYQVIHQEAVSAGVDDFAADLAIDGADDIAECLADRDRFLGGAQVLVAVAVDEAHDLLSQFADGDPVIRFHRIALSLAAKLNWR